MSAVADESPAPSSARSARLVAAGILSSRVAGFVRQRVFAHYFGTSLYADVFNASLRMPNVLQTLLGEGTLSASFIPVYADLLERGRREEAGRVAGAILALLTAVAGALALVGLLLAPLLVDIFLRGFEGERRELAITLTRIIFPMTGVLVLSAWSLGVLNSHRRFFLPYVAPVFWNAAMIGTLILLGGQLSSNSLVIALAWGALVGGLLQFAVQLPWVFSLEPNLRVRWDTRLAPVRTAIGNAGPAILGRGVVQLSSWVDLFLASFLAIGAVAALGYAQMLYLLPISLFGMAVAAAELPELSRRPEALSEALRPRVDAGLRRIAFLVVPSLVGYAILGEVIVAGIFQTGEFGAAETRLVYLVLLGYTTGLLASTSTRLFASVFFAMRDTRTPARIAVVRVACSGVLGLALMIPLDRVAITPELRLGAMGLSLAAGLAAWLEWGLLRRELRRRIGRIGTGAGPLLRMFAAALLPALAARLLILVLPPISPLPLAAVVLLLYGLLYLLLGHLFGLPEAAATLGRIVRR
jgi:putative peptidoglycan lipid II flippase